MAFRYRFNDEKIKAIEQACKENKDKHADARSKASELRLPFQGEAGFGRISKPKYRWAEKGIRPRVPCRRIREYRSFCGAAERRRVLSCDAIHAGNESHRTNLERDPKARILQ